MECKESTKNKLRELKEQYSDVLEHWAKFGNTFEKSIVKVVTEGSK